MKKIFKIGCLIMVLGLLSLPAWSSDNAGMGTDSQLILAHNGHGDGTGDGPIDGDGDCDGDGPWWDGSMSQHNLLLAHNGHVDGTGDGPIDGDGDCDGDGPWWDI